MSSIRTILAYGFPVEPINALQVATMEVMEWPTSRTAFHQLQARHPLLIRASDPPVRPSRFEESLQTPGGTTQRDLDLAAHWDSGRKISLSGLEIGLVRARASAGRRFKKSASFKPALPT